MAPAVLQEKGAPGSLPPGFNPVRIHQPWPGSCSQQISSLLPAELLNSLKFYLYAVTVSLSSTLGCNSVWRWFVQIPLMEYESVFLADFINFIFTAHSLNFVLFNRSSSQPGSFFLTPSLRIAFLEQCCCCSAFPSAACRRCPNKKWGLLFCELLI